MHAKARGQHPVVGRGRTAALNVAGHDHPGFHAHPLLELVGDAVGDGGEGHLAAAQGQLLLGQLGLLGIQRPLGHGQDGKALACPGPRLHGIGHGVDVIG